MLFLAVNLPVSNTMTNVTRPACGIPAAPMLAAVDVMLHMDDFVFRFMTTMADNNNPKENSKLNLT